MVSKQQTNFQSGIKVKISLLWLKLTVYDDCIIDDHVLFKLQRLITFYYFYNLNYFIFLAIFFFLTGLINMFLWLCLLYLYKQELSVSANIRIRCENVVQIGKSDHIACVVFGHFFLSRSCQHLCNFRSGNVVQIGYTSLPVYDGVYIYMSWWIFNV